ncbi:MAG: hypothetical protein FJW20_18755 [Acidimicrobiia bacterium]|nr:hypothetical protein [Acidimicrobiia bacterium]
MNPNDWASLQANYIQNTYYRVDLTWRGMKADNAGVRSRGNGSRNPRKPGLKIDFGKFTKNRRFVGLDTLVLDNLWQDDSMLIEPLIMELFRKLEVPAPRGSFARLFINGQYHGLYAMVEDVDQGFLARNFENPLGHLYEYKWILPWRFNDLGPDPATYVPTMFKPATHESRPEPEGILELIQAANSPDPEDFARRIRTSLHIKSFLIYLAVDNFLCDGDGLNGRWAMNNFFLYRPPGSAMFHWIPWDKDGAFDGLERPLLYGVADNVLMRRLLAVPEHAAFFLETVDKIANQHAGEGNWMSERASTYYNLIRNAVLADPNKRVTAHEFETHVTHVRYFIEDRPWRVMEEVEPLRNLPPEEWLSPH